jgi:hypothetical protein
MSSPTVGPEPNYTPGGAPDGSAGWSASPPPPPPPSYGNPPPSYGDPAPTYGSAPAGFGEAAAGRPPQVLVAAILGFVVALFLLWAALAFLAFSTLGVFAGLAIIFGIVFLALAAVNVWGGVLAIQGKGSVMLLVAGGITALFSLISLIGNFTFESLLALLIGAATVFLLLQPQSKQYFAARGKR